MSYPDQYGDRGNWPDSRGAHRRPGPPPQGSQWPSQPPLTRQAPAGRPAPPPAQPARRSGGADGNERLTAMTGAVLLILLAAEGITILRIGRLLTVHVFLGMLLLGPVALKAGSVVYRFTRYYTGNAPYRRKGPPAPLLRLLGPVIMLLTACVFGSGVLLVVVGRSQGPWLFLHKASFVLWFCAMAIHVLAYAPRLPRLLAAEARGTVRTRRAAEFLGGRGTRLTLLLASLAAGLVIALLTVHLAGNWWSTGSYVKSEH